MALNIRFGERPRIEDARCTVEPIEGGLTRVSLRYGFVEQPDITAALKQVTGLSDTVALDGRYSSPRA